MKLKAHLYSAFIFTSALAFANNASAAPTIYQGSGDITTAVDQFRTALGGSANGATAGDQTSGRREINWDGVSSGLTNSDDFPGNFFNVNTTRGVILSTL